MRPSAAASAVIPGLQLRSKRRLIAAVLLSLFGALCLFHLDDAFSVHLRDLGYITRPIWDKAPVPFTTVYTLDATVDPSATDFCERHRLDPSASRPKIYDAVIFSVELDLLEVRIHELYDVIDTFVIVESNVTFSGEPKPLVYHENSDRFRFAQDKIVYHAVTDLHVYSPASHGSLRKEAAQRKENPMDNEIRMRQGVGSVISSLRPEAGSLIVQSDVDEMPSAQALKLLKQCSGWGDAIHLGMPTYLYSFEFPMQRTEADNGVGQGHGPRQTRASVKRYNPDGTSYTHSRITDTILERAGWHCTFCFRYLQDFVFKMTSYSHNDRVTSSSQLAFSQIQKKICAGKDVFDMLPEVYDFSSLIKQFGPIPRSTQTDGLPSYLFENKEEMRYLLPGGCQREAKPGG